MNLPSFSFLNARVLKIVGTSLAFLFFGYYLYLFFSEKSINYPTTVIFVAITLYTGVYMATQSASSSAKTIKKNMSKNLESEIKNKILQGLSYSNDTDTKSENRLSNSELDYISGIMKKLLEKEVENINKHYLQRQFLWFFLLGFIGVFLTPLVLFLLSRLQF